jgi:hypothetical protein
MVKGAVEDIFPNLKEEYIKVAEKTEELRQKAKDARNKSKE